MNTNPMKQILLTMLYVLVLLAIGISCTPEKPRYVIGVSQCSADIWREKQNAELRMGTYFQDGVELRFAAAYDSDERQIEQIDSLLHTGIDLLIVAPNQVQTISPAIDRAFDSGIPVIVFERKTNSQKFTAFIGADNYEMGRQMGQYVAGRLKHHGRIMVVKGLEGSSPAIERHKGFIDVISQYPDLHVVATLQGDWTEQTAYRTVREWRAQHPDEPIDLVFGLNDRTAMGARKALQEADEHRVSSGKGGGRVLPLFCGIDGLPGEGGGIELVRDSILEASYIYPTHGDKLLQLAVDILEGKPYQKESRLQSALVTRDNANVLLMQTEELKEQGEYLDQLHQKADAYLQQLDTQRTITLLSLVVIGLLVIAIVLFYLYHIGKMTLRQERVVNTLWNMKPETVEVPDSVAGNEVRDIPKETPQSDTDEQAPPQTAESGGDDDSPTSASTPSSSVSADSQNLSATLFMTRFREAVEARLEDSELSVEDLAADMNLSRVQLYRKVKSLTGSTPVELLRTARLKRAYQLLLTTDKSVSEVAYQVGFTAPSYFTKCFKDEYGKLPGELRS